MNENSNSINKKTSISLSRNIPVALVVGAAGFLGSHLTDKLLDKSIQVVGVDDLENGDKRNLAKATGNRNFHLVIGDVSKIESGLARLDYLFIVSQEGDLTNILNIFKNSKCRMLLVSSIDLYEKGEQGQLKWFKEAESKIAKVASDNHLNARVLRLGPVFGPRMDFKGRDPILKLIQQTLTGDLQKQVTLEFSSRAIYVLDAVDLMIRTIFAGSTAQKIFDGVAPVPVKVEEIKLILLDPVWHESRDFIPSELPPWPTPNLDKTVKFLNWHPGHKLVASLKQTLSYFKDSEIKIPELEIENEKLEDGKKQEDWKEEKKEELESFKQIQEEPSEKIKFKKGIKLPKFSVPLSKIYLLAVVLLTAYALIWPALNLVWGVLTFRYQISEAVRNLEKGQFEKSLGNIKQANVGLTEARSIFVIFDPVRKTGFFKEGFELGDNLSNLAQLSITGAQSTVLGVEALFQSLRAVTGELTQSPTDYFSTAQVELAQAGESLSQVEALIKSSDFSKNLPKVLESRINSLSGKLAIYSHLVKKAQALGVLLPNIVALNGSKNYLVLLQNNLELRPAGGFIGSFAIVSFEGGKLKKLEVNDIYAIDGKLQIHVEPPKEIKEDLGQKDWYLRDSNWEPDFPTSARQAEWFYTKETGERVEGVIAIDISAMEKLLSLVGPLNLTDYKEKITAENLFEKAITYAETGFFPGSQAKKSFLTALTNELFNRIFFLPQNNWPGIVSSLGESLDEKHISVYLNDPKLFSYLVSVNFTHALPRASNQTKSQDFLSLVEANLGANKVNYYLDRNYSLETVIGKDGEIKHRLRISYTNRSPSDTFPGGKYKNRMRIYLPFGSKLSRLLWGESDVTKDVVSFVDYGRSGFSFLLELSPKEQKTLVLDYEVPAKVDFQEGKATYRLDIVKQAGTLKDPLQWSISYPISYQIVSNQAKVVGPQEQTIQTDLSRDRSFEVEFKK